MYCTLARQDHFHVSSDSAIEAILTGAAALVPRSRSHIYESILSCIHSLFAPCKVGLIALNCLGEVLGFLGYREAGQGSILLIETSRCYVEDLFWPSIAILFMTMYDYCKGCKGCNAKA